MLGAVLKSVAALYALAGAAALLVAFVMPSADPLSAVFAIVLGLPWTLLLRAFEPPPDGGTPAASMAVVVGAVLVNAGLLWWTASALAARLNSIAKAGAVPRS